MIYHSAMPIEPLDRRIILQASQQEFESQAVLNPAAFFENGLLHLFYRAVQPGNYSSIGYAIFKDDVLIHRSPEPILRPETAPEMHGLEDPRLIKLGETYYLFYTVYDGKDIQIAYATATTLPHFQKHPAISPPITYGEIKALCDVHGEDSYLCKYSTLNRPPHNFLWDKDAFIFPEHIHGKLVLVHRIQPEIQLLYFNDFNELTHEYWNRYLSKLESHTLLTRKYWFESAYVGGGAPPVRTPDGWLFIYHAVEQGPAGLIYRAGAALLDLDHPLKVIGRLDYPLFGPDEEWEKVGDVGNVVFPTAVVVQEDLVDIYYGAADKRIGKISFPLSQLLTELHNSPEGVQHERTISPAASEAVGA